MTGTSAPHTDSVQSKACSCGVRVGGAPGGADGAALHPATTRAASSNATVSPRGCPTRPARVRNAPGARSIIPSVRESLRLDARVGHLGTLRTAVPSPCDRPMTPVPRQRSFRESGPAPMREQPLAGTGIAATRCRKATFLQRDCMKVAFLQLVTAGRRAARGGRAAPGRRRSRPPEARTGRGRPAGPRRGSGRPHTGRRDLGSLATTASYDASTSSRSSSSGIAPSRRIRFQPCRPMYGETDTESG
jgi:hypothetical protein